MNLFESINLTDLIEDVNKLKNNDYDERITDLENISAETRLLKLEQISPRHDELHKEWWQRLEKLENLIDIDKAEQIIMDGAQLHLAILKFEKRMKDLEEKAEKLMSAKPHKCPVCSGFGQWLLLSLEEIAENNGCKYEICKPCEGKGIVWS